MKLTLPHTANELTPPHVEAAAHAISDEVTRDAQIAQAQAAKLAAQNIESQGRVAPVPTRGRGIAGDDTQ